MENDKSEEIYIQQLKQVFDSCDLADKGYINRNELIDLAQKLQLGDQVPALLTEILGNKFDEGEVQFDAFREGFINVLAKTIDHIDHVTEDEQSEWSDLGESFSSQHFLELSKQNSYEDSQDVFHHSKQKNGLSNTSSRKAFSKRKTSTPNVKSKSKANKHEQQIEGRELFVDATNTTEAQTSDVFSSSNSERDMLKRVWDDAVGELGFINLHQLSSLCELIGMGKMEEYELELLFKELDTDEDGLVSFNEFANGLFHSKILKDVSAVKEKEEMSAKSMKSETNRKIKAKKLKSKKSAIVENLSFLDPMNSGYVTAEQLKNHFYKSCGREELQPLWKKLEFDNTGRIELKKLSEQLEGFLVEHADVLINTIFWSYKLEVSHLRGQIGVSRAELDLYKVNLSKLDLHNASLIREGEDMMKTHERQNKNMIKSQAQNFADRLSMKERELIRERDSMLQSHQLDIRKLEEKFEKLKTDDGKTKFKLKEATAEILRLEDNLKSTIDELNLERKRHTRLEKELENSHSFKDKICELESQVSAVSDYRDKQRSQIKELEKLNKELRDQNDEYLVQIENLSLTNNSRRSQQSRTGSPASENLSRNGSYLSDYMKPNVIKRNEFGDSCDDDRIIAVSESGVYAIGNMDDMNMKISDQEAVITSLRRDLEMVNKLLHENSSNNDERHTRELSRLTDRFAKEMSDLQNLMAREKSQLISSYSREKEDIVNRYEDKIEKMRREREQSENRWETTSDTCSEVSFRKERRKIEHLFREEKEELEMNFRSQVTKLEEKIVILETEKAEMELKFLNEKAELEQQFRIEKAELQQNATTTNREFDRSQKYIDFLKDDLEKKHIRDIEEMERTHKKDKQGLTENLENDMSEMSKQHHKDMGELRKSFNHQIGELKKTFSKERGSMREGFTREKSEIEQRFLREKTELEDTLRQEYDHKITVRLADLRKMSMEERAEVDERVRDEKYQLSKELQMEAASHEREIKQLKSELELKHAEEKSRMKEDFEYAKSRLENKYMREISQLQQAFSGGEAGMKGKMKEDFTMLLQKYKREWESSYEKEKLELQESFAREKSELEESWNEDKNALLQNFEQEKMEMDSIFLREKQEMTSKFQAQKDELETEYKEENEKLNENKESELKFRVDRETEILRNSAEHFEKELILIREQKKELETKNQILELKSLSQVQEAKEIKQVQSERKKIDVKVANLLEEVELLRQDKEKLQMDLKSLVREKSTILDNSVQEITEQQEKIAKLQSEKEAMQDKIEQLLIVEKDGEDLKLEYSRINHVCEKQKENIEMLSQVEEDNVNLNETIRELEHRERELEANIQDKTLKISRLEEEVTHYQNKIDNIENINKKEFGAMKERLDMQTTAAATEKSRYQRELNELKDHLSRANASSDRDIALKQKVFNDAKGEVMNLNKKLEEKTRQIRSLEESLKSMESRLSSSMKENESLDDQVKVLRLKMNDSHESLREEKRNLTTKSMRSDTLVTDLYLENADLMKQLANAESDKIKSDKSVRQLTDQKRALQRVISKLCHANGISNPTTT